MRRITLLLLALCFALPATALADGASDYQTYCSTCHGTGGKGDGAAAAAMDPKPADFSNPDFYKTRDDALLTKVIKEGGAAVGKSAMMAPWGSVLNDEQIKAVVAHIKSLAAK
jgi:mono/diheme cytochrome c family protein